jgi:hypothetical protein
MNEVIEFARETKVVALKFAKKYNLQYVGELAERWHERNIVQTREDLLGLIMGMSLCDPGKFLYDQKKRFIKSVCEYLKTNWSPTAAAAILNFGRREIDEMTELAATLDMLIQSDIEVSDQSERILLISLLSETYASRTPIEGLRNYTLKVIDGLQLSWTNIHVEYPLLLLLSDVYTDLQKPTAKEFKTKGMSRMLQVISALRTKEVSQGQNYHLFLGADRDIIPTLNFYLAYQNTPRNHSITGPGFDRIKENFINCHFMSDQDVPKEVVAIIDGMIQNYENSSTSSNPENHPLQFLLNRLSYNGKSQFPNKNNLKLLVAKANAILMPNVNESYISLLQEDVVEDSQRSKIIEELLTGHYSLTKEQFDYLEDQRSKAGLTIKVNSTYTEKCLKYGYISLENVDDLEERGMVAFVIEILKRQESYAELVSLLERVKEIPYHKFLTEDYAFNKLKSKMDDTTKKRLYPLYLNALMTFRASKYAEVIFEMVRSNEFVELFGTSTAEVDDIERQLYINNLLPESTAKSIREKYMTAEELEAVRTQELCEELKRCTRYGLHDFARKHWRKISEREALRQAFVEKMITVETKDKYDVGGVLLLFYQLRARNVFTQEEIERIEVAALEKAEKIKID